MLEENFVVPQGAAVSNSIRLSSLGALGENLGLCGIYQPAALTGTEWEVEGSPDNATWYGITDTAGTGTPTKATFAASKAVPIDPRYACQWQYIRIKTGANNQADARTFVGAFRPV